jgi:hypothetical protein
MTEDLADRATGGFPKSIRKLIMRSLIVWTLLIFGGEHSWDCACAIAPAHVGDFRPLQIGIYRFQYYLYYRACVYSMDWRKNVFQLLGVGGLWVALTLMFEIGLGRLVIGYCCETTLFRAGFCRLYDGPLLAPLLEAKMRGV